MKKISLFLLITMLVSLQASAIGSDVGLQELIDGISYRLDPGTKTATVVFRKINAYGYNGIVTIPATVTNNNGVTYNVKYIESEAFYDCAYLTSVTIPNSVVEIGDDAFRGCSRLTSIEIPNGVNKIGAGVFYGCSGLTSIEIPKSVSKIGEEAFFKCSNLTKVELNSNDIVTKLFDSSANFRTFFDSNQVKECIIGSSVMSIGSSFFSGCSGLTSVTIGNSVKSIGESAFSGCSGLTSITIPNSLKSIGKDAFDGTAWYNNQPDGLVYAGLVAYKYKGTMLGNTTISIKEGTLGIAGSAFEECSGLTSVTIPKSMQTIGSSAFYGCSSLTSVHVTDLAAWCKIGFGSNPLYIAHHLFMNGKEVKDLVIPNSVTSIGSSAFYGCSGLTSVTIPNSVISIAQNAFYGCSGLTSVTIPNSMQTIRDSAFEGCTGLTSVHITDLTAWCKIGFSNSSSNPLSYAHHLFMDGKEKKIISREEVKTIRAYAFSGCSGLTSVGSIVDGTSIGKYAFENCTGLTNLLIYNGDITIAQNAFSGCYFTEFTNFSMLNAEENNYWGATINVSRYKNGCIIKDGTLIKYIGNETSVTIPNSVTSIGNEAFSGCSGLTSVTIPNSVTVIGEKAFSGCSGLTSVTIGNSVTSIGYDAFYGCSGLTSVHITDLTAWCKIVFSNYSSNYSLNYSSNYSSNPLTYAHHLYLNGNEIVKDLVIPNSVTSIGSYAFSGCSGLTSVTIPNSVQSIGNYAFSGCPDLTKVTINGSFDNFLKSFGSQVKECIIGSSVKSIGKDAFSGCSGLTSVTIGNSVTSIRDGAFSGCSGLKTITIPNKVTSIGEKAFSGCSGLKTITIPNKVTSIEYGAFKGCSGLTSVTIPNSVTSIGDYAFSWCSGLTSVTIPNNVTSIGRYAFYVCSGLTSVTIPNSVTSIGDNAFYDCSGLTSVTIPNSVISIGKWAFSGCSGLTSVHITDLAKWCGISFSDSSSNPLSYAHHLFVNGKEIKDLVIPNSVTSVGNYAFYNCTGLTSINIHYNVTSIGSSAFSGCYIAEQKFSNISPLRATTNNYWGATIVDSNDNGLIIKDGTLIKYVGNENSVTIPNSVTSIGSDVFSNCPGLTKVILNNNAIASKSYSSSSNLGTIFGSQVKEYIIGNSVTSIGSSAFYNCSGLTNVTIGNNVTSIGYDAFRNCSNLTYITIPNSVTSVGNYAFRNCNGLKKVELNNNAIASKSYSSSSNLGTIFGSQVKEYIIGNSVTSIGYDAFYGCSGLTSVTIPNSVTSIGSYAFYGCSGLTSVTIPNSVTSIGGSAFYNCSGLTSVHITDLAAWCKIYFSNSSSNPLSYAHHLFINGKEIKDMVIPNNVTSIGNYAFYGYSSLNSVTCEATSVPSTGSNVFASSNIANATLYVPSSSVDTYKTSTPWSGFGNILALPEPLNYYDYGLTMKTLTYKTEWADVLNSAPNAVALAEAELEEWAASQTNVIVRKNNAYYCPNFILTDLTETAGSGYEKTGFYSPYEFTAKKGSYRRQAYAGYNTICVPFSFTASDLSGTAKTYAFEHYDDGEGKAIFKRVTGTIAAGTPCIVKESGNVVWNINLANKKISASSSSEDSHMRGTFVSTDVYQGKGYSPNSANEFSPLSQYLHPFRACLILGSVSGARAIRLVLDDAVTDIDEVEVDSATLKNGKYLEKGKLVIYKSGRKYNANGSTIK